MSGWRASTAGYLSEQALVTAAAIFARIHGQDPTEARLALKPYLQKDFAKAYKATGQIDDWAKHLAAVDLLEWTYS